LDVSMTVIAQRESPFASPDHRSHRIGETNLAVPVVLEAPRGALIAGEIAGAERSE
jgi:hypothetical protein